MRQRWWLNLALLGVILVLGALVFYTIEQEKPTELPKLTDLETDQVGSIRIERADSDPIFLMKNALGFWQMVTPFNLPANSYHVERLLQLLSERTYKQLDASQVNLAELKLEPPLATVKYNQLTVAFGDSSPMNDGQRYILINNNIYLLADTIYYSVNSEALRFISLSPLGNNSKITELKMPDYHLTLTEGRWTLTSTFSSDEIDTRQDTINALIDNWQNASAYKVEDYDAKSSAKQGQIDITLLGLEQPLHFIIVSTTPDLVLARPEKRVQYQFSVSQVEKLLHLPTKEQSESSIEGENQEKSSKEKD